MHVAPLRSENPFGIPSLQARAGRDEIIKKIALQTVVELTLSLAIGTIVSFYVVPSAFVLLFSYIAVQSLINLSLRSIEAFSSIEFQKIFRWSRSIIFSRGVGFDAQIGIHEEGHAVSTYLVYQKPAPRIQITPRQGGVTSFCRKPLTPFGKWLGVDGSLALVTAAGPFLTLFISSIVLALGLKLKRTRPEVGAYLISYAVTDFLSHAAYALSTLWTPSTVMRHDFVCLATFTTISPILLALGILAVPLLITRASETAPLTG